MWFHLAGAVVVRAGAGGVLLRGEAAPAILEALLPLLDGTRSRNDIRAALPDIDAAEVGELLQQLETQGLVLERMAVVAPSAPRIAIAGDAEWPARVAAALRASRTAEAVIGCRAGDAHDLGLGIFAEDSAAAAVDFARRMREAGLPSLCCVVGRSEAILGPLALPRRSPCWNCARLRLRANAAWRAPEAASGSIDADGLARRLAAEALAAAGARADDAGPGGHILILEGEALRSSRHALLGVPGCPICGGPSSATARVEGSATELATQALQLLVDDRVGIIHRILVEPADEDHPMPPIIATAIPADAPIEGTERRPMPAGWGKGMSAETAMLGAIGEAVERYAGSLPNLARIVWRRPAELEGAVLHPRDFALYDEAQYASAGFPFLRFDESVAHPWIAGTRLADGGPIWVPAILTFLSLEIERSHSFCQGSSNGMAAAGDTDEAALRAILELIERDAFMTSWLCRRPGRGIRLDAALEPELAAILRNLTGLGATCELRLLDGASPYPTALCLGFGDGRAWPGAALGLAADPDPRRAIRQAILELGQTGPYLRAMMRRELERVPAGPAAVRDMLDHARYYFPAERAAAFDFLREASPWVALGELPPAAERSLPACARALTGRGVRVALVDVTPADIAATPFRIVRAVSPDLQPIAFGHGLERLPVPRLVELGLKAPKDSIAPIW